MIDAVIFDLGNVLVTVDWSRVVVPFTQRTGRSWPELTRIVDGGTEMNRLARGEITPAQIYQFVVRELSFVGSYEEFAFLFANIFSPIEPMLALAARLKGRARCYILSNTNVIHIERAFRDYPVLHDFEGHLLSHEAGLLKPDPAIYRRALAKFDLHPERTVFVDDLMENVAGARAVGMCAIQHRTVEATRQELTKLGVLPI